MGAEAEHLWNWGGTKSYETKYDGDFKVKAKKGKSVHAKAVINQGVLSVPYTMTLESKSGVVVESKGTWHGVTSWNVRCAYSEMPALGS